MVSLLIIWARGIPGAHLGDHPNCALRQLPATRNVTQDGLVAKPGLANPSSAFAGSGVGKIGVVAVLVVRAKVAAQLSRLTVEGARTDPG
jgi:hypothetical protein